MEPNYDVGDVVRYDDKAWTVEDVRGDYADLARFEGAELKRANSVHKRSLRMETPEELAARQQAVES